MADYFCSEPPNILPFEGTGIGYKSIVELKVFAQPMHSLPTKILISFALLAQPDQNIANWSD